MRRYQEKVMTVKSSPSKIFPALVGIGTSAKAAIRDNIVYSSMRLSARRKSR